MSTNNPETAPSGTSAFEQRSREVLEESASRLSGRTLSRLTQARYAALEQAKKPERVWWRAFAPAGAVAAVAVFAIGVFVSRGPSELPIVTAGTDTALDAEVLADVETLELVEEGDELEFYEWAALEVSDDATMGS